MLPATTSAGEADSVHYASYSFLPQYYTSR